MSSTNSKITPFLTFAGNAEEALNFYGELFDSFRIINLMHQANGKVMLASFSIKEQTFMCIDSVVPHEWTFTPGISLFVDCDTAEEIDRLYEGLADGGAVLMPLDDSPFSEKFGWVNDKFGVSWQLNLPKAP